MGRLDAEAHYLSQGIEREGLDYFKHVSTGLSRVSWVAPDGTVLYDSIGERRLPNHADREEIRRPLSRERAAACAIPARWVSRLCTGFSPE